MIMIWTKRKTSITIDVTICLFVLVMTILLRAGLCPIRKQGFYCNDASISYPVLDESLKTMEVMVIILFLPVVVILPIEVLLLAGTLTRSLRISVRRFATVYVAFLFGFSCVIVLIKFLKAVTGELRPNFFAVCQPDFSKINCSQGYITEYTCTSDFPPAIVADAYMSFPSGHTSITFYMATFLILYLQKYVGFRPTALAASMSYLMLIGFAIYAGYSRIVERQHHWWDVLFGAIFGIIFGVYAVFAFLFKGDGVLSLIQQRPPPPDDRPVDVGQNAPGSGVQLKDSTVFKV